MKVCLLDTANRLIGFEEDDGDRLEDDVLVPDSCDLIPDGRYLYMRDRGVFVCDRIEREPGKWMNRNGDPMGKAVVTVQEVAQSRAGRQLRKMQRRKRRQEQKQERKQARRERS